VFIFTCTITLRYIYIYLKSWNQNKQHDKYSRYNITRILHTVYLGYDRDGKCSINKVVDLVPEDMCLNAMIAFGWIDSRSLGLLDQWCLSFYFWASKWLCAPYI